MLQVPGSRGESDRLDGLRGLSLNHKFMRIMREAPALSQILHCKRRPWIEPMKVRNSLKSLRTRHRDNRLVRRKGRVYIINKTQKRYKARQG